MFIENKSKEEEKEKEENKPVSKSGKEERARNVVDMVVCHTWC